MSMNNAPVDEHPSSGHHHHHHHHHQHQHHSLHSSEQRHKSHSPQPLGSTAGVDSRWAHQTVFSSFTTPPIEDKVINHKLAFPAVHPHYDPKTMHMALEWHGPKDMRVIQRPRPLVTESHDAVVRVTTATVCGSDLHLYHDEFKPFMHVGDITGHESMGIVESVGPEVKHIRVGDRVVVSAVIACGHCGYCKAGLFSACENTNPAMEMQQLMGHRAAAMFGYSHLVGGFDGGQAEFVRVPFADVNCLRIGNDQLKDEQVLFLSDILCTGWHANVLGGVGPGTSVAIWGAGPVGLMAAMWAKYRGAKQVVIIDGIADRLNLARTRLGVETVDYTRVPVLKTIQELIPGGPDIAIDACGFRYTKGIDHKVMRAMKMETDTPEVLTEAITLVRKGGTIAVVGDYFNNTNNYPIGAFMEKGLTMRSGQVNVQAYWKDLLRIIENNEVDPTFVITHTLPLEQGPLAYQLFDEKRDGAIKILLKTPFGASAQSSGHNHSNAGNQHH